jgi:RimJ/RimL family protein N-acetyltransferase
VRTRHAAIAVGSPPVNAVIVLETDRLVLRHLTLNDAPFIVELLNEPSFLRFIGDRRVRSQQDARQYILNGPIASYKKNGFGLWLAFLKETGDPIGICGLLKRDTLQDPDVGFAFLPAYWRQGYAFESASAVLKYGCESLGMKRIVAITSPDNAASIGALEKMGMKFEGIIRLDGDSRDVRLFAMEGS